MEELKLLLLGLRTLNIKTQKIKCRYLKKIGFQQLFRNI